MILTHLSSLLHTYVRGEDIVCRMGGEEFLMIVPDANREVTLQRAESIRAAIQAIHIDYNQTILKGISVSIGVAIYPGQGSTRDEILEIADQALYTAKRNGRNRVEEASRPMSS